MNLIRKTYWKLYLGFTPRMSKTNIITKLSPYMGMHDIVTAPKHIHFHDIDMNLMMRIKGYVPIDSVAYGDIVNVRKVHNGRGIRILLRSGNFLMLDKHTPYRSCRSIFTEPRKPYPGELRMWNMWRKLKREN